MMFPDIIFNNGERGGKTHCALYSVEPLCVKVHQLSKKTQQDDLKLQSCWGCAFPKVKKLLKLIARNFCLQRPDWKRTQIYTW